MDKKLIPLTLLLWLGFMGDAVQGDWNAGLVAHWEGDKLTLAAWVRHDDVSGNPEIISIGWYNPKLYISEDLNHRGF